MAFSRAQKQSEPAEGDLKRRMHKMIRNLFAAAALFSVILFFGGCTVGPNYHRPTAPVPQTFKEEPPAGWKQAQPNEAITRGKWWEIYNDPILNGLEEQVSISNQNVIAAMQQYREARDQIRISRSSLFPSVTASPAVTGSQISRNILGTGLAGATRSTATVADYTVPFDVSYQADVWGSIRRGIRSSAASAQATAAQLENVRLTNQAQLAEFYFELHGLDSQLDLLQRTSKIYEQYLQLTKDRFELGVASGADVALAETQLYTTNAQLVDLGVLRAQYEHAIATLIGKPPAELTIAPALLKGIPPATPPGVASMLLERRPDIATAERDVAAQNEQIGIAIAAYYPTITLSASAGLESTSIGNLFTWPSRFWSAGPQAAQIIFNGGRRHATVDLQRAGYDATAANYRQTVLTAFQQVEDELAALRILEKEAASEDQAVAAAQNSLDISTEQYKQGIITYLNVITTQSILLQDEITAVNILNRRLTASVLLVEALGGGWDASKLPTYQQMLATK
jgi:NodT family efflux transporter outer membrane factor (OMF) lipoprotein